MGDGQDQAPHRGGGQRHAALGLQTARFQQRADVGFVVVVVGGLHFFRQAVQKKICKYLVDNNFIDCIIQLPSNLFFGTSIATCIMVLKKGKTDNKVLFIDASSECVKVTNNNKLTPENINKIVDTFAQRAEEAHFSHLAEYSEVQKNDYNLSVSTYVEAKDTREKIDIVKLNAEIAQIVARENELRAAIDQIVAEIEG